MGHFTVADAAADVGAKLVRRHPHVFGDEPRLTKAGEVIGKWEEMKAEEARSAGRTGLAGRAGRTNERRYKNIPGFHLVLVLGQTNVPAIKEAAEKKLVTHVSLAGLPKKKGAEFLTEALRYRTGRFGGMMHLFAEDITEDPFKPLALDASLRYLEQSLGTPERMR